MPALTTQLKQRLGHWPKEASACWSTTRMVLGSATALRRRRHVLGAILSLARAVEIKRRRCCKAHTRQATFSRAG
eukprot:CAMPEP_0172737816 /NCGR_PEP_ID=MMETSP1074-20121228/118664_1 /TAXON_ID=2916 /ORGANISM="Ceratium fusus, Strain PA161109" /LENGTH=74 /DNA_ID=CAMNT_0013567305 /DNA_START=409 /DNA_END=629 /DNA_ORIENTATION=-